MRRMRTRGRRGRGRVIEGECGRSVVGEIQNTLVSMHGAFASYVVFGGLNVLCFLFFETARFDRTISACL